jgi:serine/threonine protein phosphatase PrpC
MTQGEILRLDIADILSAALIPGRKRPLHGKHGDLHSSDALLVSRAVPVIAVADGPERNPTASSSFLRKFDDALSASQIRFEGRPIAESFAAVVELVTALMKTIDYHDSTTFSALIPVTDGNTPQAIVLHTGDSLILKIETETGGVTQVSRTSHVLVGRAPALFQTEIIPLCPDDLMVLASDGITDLARTHGVVPAALLSYGFPRAPRSVVQRIVDAAAGARVRLDDISIICAVAHELSAPADGPSPKPLILT